MKTILLTLFLALCIALSQAQSDSLLTRDDSLQMTNHLPVFNTSSDDAEAGPEQQDVSSLLQSARDVFAQFAGFQFSNARYRMRGLAGKYTEVSVNGLVMNNPETGTASWSAWGGLNDVMRFPEVKTNVTASRLFFSDAGGFANFESKASGFKKGTRVTYSAGNRSYQQRLVASVFSGQMANGWSYSASASLRYGNQVYVPGTFFNGDAFYFSADKKINQKHSLALTTFYSPLQQGRTAASTKEVYQITNNSFYNSNWGLQNGKVRNAAVSRQSRPVMILQENWKLSENARLITSACLTYGKNSISGLTWNEADNPDPDYYRYLPSYYEQQNDFETAATLQTQWENDASTRQINWDKLIRINQQNLYTAPIVLGQGVNTSETRARYILEKRVDQVSHLILNGVYNLRKGKHFLAAGIRFEKYDDRHYKQIDDLLGASYWLDVDPFAKGLGTEEFIIQNDLDNPNKKVKEGDVFGYDYVIQMMRQQVFAQEEFAGRRIDGFAALELTHTSLQRDGKMANGKFPTESKGKSEKLQFVNPQLKAGLTYKLSGRHFLTINGLAATRMPDASALFVSPRTRNQVIAEPQNEKMLSIDLSYHWRYPGFKGRVSLYHSNILDQTNLRSYWHDAYNTNVNLIMRNIDQQFDGLELGLERTIRVQHVLQFALGYGSWVYSNRPTLEAWQDNTASPLYSDRLSYLKNYKVGGTPQFATGVTYRYNARKYWFAACTFNFAGNAYVEPNPDRRTEEAVGKFTDAEQNLAQQITKQEKLPNCFFVNANAGKSYRFKKKYNLNIGLSVNNILNNRHLLVSGFESLRWDQTNLNKFANKYTYMQGFNLMLNLSLNL